MISPFTWSPIRMGLPLLGYLILLGQFIPWLICPWNHIDLLLLSTATYVIPKNYTNGIPRLKSKESDLKMRKLNYLELQHLNCGPLPPAVSWSEQQLECSQTVAFNFNICISNQVLSLSASQSAYSFHFQKILLICTSRSIITKISKYRHQNHQNYLAHDHVLPRYCYHYLHWAQPGLWPLARGPGLNH